MTNAKPDKTIKRNTISRPRSREGKTRKIRKRTKTKESTKETGEEEYVNF